MALGETAELVARLTLDSRGFGRAIGNATRDIGKLDSKFATSGDRWYKAGAQIGTGIKAGVAIGSAAIGFLATNVGLGLRQLVELESLAAQTGAVIKSTGGAAGITADEVRNLAEKFEGLNATIDDKVIQNAENLLLTFTAVTKEGFEPALLAALDMNTALGGGEEGLQGNLLKVGKALQDPIKGITALRKAGVNFTDAQIEQIKALQKSGDLLGAQKIVLAELNEEFGGSFLAGGGTTAGRVAKFKDSIEDLQKALATALLPTVGKVADKLSAFLADPATIDTVTRLGDKIAGLFTDENISKGAGLIKDAFETIQSALPGLTSAAQITGSILSTAVGLFKSLPPDLQRLAITALAVNKLTGGLVTNVVGGLASLALGSLKTITAPHVTVIGGTVTGVGGGVPGAVPGKTGPLGSALKFLGGALVVTGVVAVATDVSGLTDPKHQTGDPARPIVRGTNIPAEQLAFQRQALAVLRARVAGGETGIVVRQLAAVEAEVARLEAIVAGGTSTLGRKLDATIGGLSRTAAAAEASGAAIRAKDFNVNVTVQNRVTTNVSVRQIVRSTSVVNNYGRVAS